MKQYLLTPGIKKEGFTLFRNQKIKRRFLRGFTPLRNQGTKGRFLTGFTLIELLIVMAIIGILATVILTTAYVMKEKARAIAGQGMIRSVGPAIYMCIDGGGTIQKPGNIVVFPNAIYKYGGNNICSDITITDAKYPDLTGTYWSYYLDDERYGFDLSKFPINYGGYCNDPKDIYISRPCNNHDRIDCVVMGERNDVRGKLTGENCWLK